MLLRRQAIFQKRFCYSKFSDVQEVIDALHLPVALKE
jgi:hypothetical protein